MSYKNYWGKAGSAQEWHRLVFHSLDVAAAGVTILKNDASLLQFFCEKLEMQSEPCLAWVSFFLAIHDHGKFSDSFQQLHPELAVILGRDTQSRQYRYRHDQLGLVLWDDLGLKLFGDKLDELNPIAMPIFGHHGKPVSNGHGAPLVSDWFTKQNQEDAFQFIQEVHEIFLKSANNIPKINLETSWWLAGFVSVCDWLGSDTEFFKFSAEEMSLQDYWVKSLEYAKKAVCRSGLSCIKMSQPLTFGELFPKIAVPSPLQAVLSQIELSHEPQLFILEDVTGAGKTEAALILAHRLISGGLGGGVYIGLPTMATSNAMHARVEEVYWACCKTPLENTKF